MNHPGPFGTTIAFERVAILHGEWWRAFTGQWLHGSSGQLFWNVMALALAGWVLCRLRGPLRLAEIFALGHLTAALTVLLLLPRWETYCGASGIAAALTGGALAAALRGGTPRLHCAAIIAALLFTLKLILESRTGAPVLVHTPGALTDWKVHAVPALAGALAGLPGRAGQRAGFRRPTRAAPNSRPCTAGITPLHCWRHEKSGSDEGR